MYFIPRGIHSFTFVIEKNPPLAHNQTLKPFTSLQRKDYNRGLKQIDTAGKIRKFSFVIFFNLRNITRGYSEGFFFLDS